MSDQAPDSSAENQSASREASSEDPKTQSGSDETSSEDDRRNQGDGSSRQNGSSGGISAGEAIRSAREVIAELTGKQPEGISAINRSGEGGWAISLDVLELSRIPASTDLLATYEVCLDGDGSLVDMERTRRYTRNQVSED